MRHKGEKSPVKKLIGVTQAALARHLDTTARYILEWEGKGYIARLPDGSYDLDDCRVRMLRHYRDALAGRSKATGGIDLSVERARLAREQTRGVAIKNALSNGELVPIKSVIEKIVGRLMRMREKMLTIPGKLAMTLAGLPADQIEGVLRDEVNELLDEVAGFGSADFGRNSGGDGSVLDGAGASLPSVAPAAEAVAGRMG